MEETINTTKTIKRGLKGIRRHLKPFRKEIIIISILGVIAAIANGLIPFLIGKFIDAIVALLEGDPLSGGYTWVAFLGIWALAQVIGDVLDWIVDRMRRAGDIKLHTSLQSNGFIHLLKLPIGFHKNSKIQELMEKLSRAGWRVAALIAETVDLAPKFLSIVFGFILALTINVQLALILIVGVLVYVVLLAIILRPVAAYDEQSHIMWSKAWDIASSAVTQVDNVKQAAAEKYEEGKIKDMFLVQTFEPWYRVELIWSNINFFQRIISFGTQVAVFAVSVHLIMNGVITLGDMIAFNSYSMMFFTPLGSLGRSWQTFQNGIMSAAYAEDIFEEKTEVYRPTNAVSPLLRGGVELRNVTFSYGDENQDVLHGVDMKVNAGEVIALVGESGSGKTTALSLVSGYFFPQKGEVLIDNIPSDTFDLTSLRKQIAIVPQEVTLFNDTIEKNIMYGSFDATHEQVVHAVTEAYLKDFIEGLPDGYQTIVGERGMKLSVGQKQRVAIARAILRDPKILILDEPTSALDAVTEKHITEALETLMKGRTTFIIAHRLSTVRKADKIFVFDKGKVVESGNHAELLAIENGFYKRLHDYQIGLY